MAGPGIINLASDDFITLHCLHRNPPFGPHPSFPLYVAWLNPGLSEFNRKLDLTVLFARLLCVLWPRTFLLESGPGALKAAR